VAIPNWIFLASRWSNRSHICAIGELCLIAFYFLLRVGEYTKPQAGWTTCTQQFCIEDIVFYDNHQPLTLAELQKNPSRPTLIRLKIDNQKNGQRGQIISQQAIPIACCPVKACVARVLELLRDNAPLDCPICAYQPHHGSKFLYVTNADIVSAVRAAITPTGAAKCGYKPHLVGSHSLWAGGAMALFIQGYDAARIMKMGRWTGQTFMLYIHEQVDILSRGAAEKMSIDLPFLNLDTTHPNRALNHLGNLMTSPTR